MDRGWVFNYKIFINFSLFWKGKVEDMFGLMDSVGVGIRVEKNGFK